MLQYITWTANPNLFDGFVTVRWYGLMFAIGFLVAYEIMNRMFKRENAPEHWVHSLFFFVVVATIIGARLGHVLFYDFHHYFVEHPEDIVKVWEGGLASHGGVLGIMVAIWLYSRWITKRPMLWTFDRVVVPTGLVAALIRIGNLMNHEIYGCATDLPWGFRFIKNIGAHMQDPNIAPVFTPPCHPTAIYEALCYLAIFALCMYMYWKRDCHRRPGLIFGTFMALVFTCRFFIEFIKNVQEPWEETMRATIGLDMGQLLSIPFVVLGVWLVIRALRRPPEELPAAASKAKNK